MTLVPRLTNHDYLQHHRTLVRLWRDHPDVFSDLSVRAQFDLHTYFQTTNLGTDAELLAERARLTAEDPSLPQRAGKALAALHDAPTKGRPASRACVPAGKGTIYVRGVMRAEPDVKQLARALLCLAEELDRQDGEDKAA